MDTGIFDDDKYFDIFVEYGRGDGEDRRPDAITLAVTI